MKVTKPGTLLFIGNSGNGNDPHLELRGWSLQGASDVPTDIGRAITVAAIRYLAECFSVALDAAPSVGHQPAPECFDAQRAALDAIAVARWRDE